MAIGTGTAILGSAALGMLGGSKKAGNTTSTQTNAPWAGVQPYLGGLYEGARNAVLSNSPSASPLFGQAANQVGSTIRGDYLNPSSNPFLRDSVNDALGLAK